MEEAMQKRIRISLSSQTEKKCSELLREAQARGDLRMAKRIMAIFAVAEGALYSVIASILKVHEESIGLWASFISQFTLLDKVKFSDFFNLL
jgi:ribosome maturation protein Sdo1